MGPTTDGAHPLRCPTVRAVSGKGTRDYMTATVAAARRLPAAVKRAVHRTRSPEDIVMVRPELSAYARAHLASEDAPKRRRAYKGDRPTRITGTPHTK